jgi:argininosuccinate synthase
MSTIVLAYSGGLDTSVLLKKYVLAGHRVVAMTLDLGESDGTAGAGASDALDEVKAKALALGAYDALLVDAKARFIDGLALPALRANALYEGIYPLSAALSRPLIAALLVETAHRYGADAVAHGCTGKGNDQVRIELAVRALDPAIKTLAPLRDEPLNRPDAIAYANANGVPISSTVAKPYSIDANLWGRSKRASSKTPGRRRRKTRTRGPRARRTSPRSPNTSRSSSRTACRSSKASRAPRWSRRST